MNSIEILVEARAKIAEPESWTQGADARDRDGNAVEPTDPTAVCWSVKGAFSCVVCAAGAAHSKHRDKAWHALREAAATIEADDWVKDPRFTDPEFTDPVEAVNDLSFRLDDEALEHGAKVPNHARVLDVLDNAIESARQAQPENETV